jgi:hypothetical protein
MDLDRYFDKVKGIGVLGTLDSEGKVDLAMEKISSHDSQRHRTGLAHDTGWTYNGVAMKTCRYSKACWNPFMHLFGFLLGASVAWYAAQTALAEAIKATRDEFRLEQHWLKQHLLECKMSPRSQTPIRPALQPPGPGLDVLAKNDAVIQNARGAGHPALFI